MVAPGGPDELDLRYSLKKLRLKPVIYQVVLKR
jgi:hypothetical protein